MRKISLILVFIFLSTLVSAKATFIKISSVRGRATGYIGRKRIRITQGKILRYGKLIIHKGKVQIQVGRRKYWVTSRTIYVKGILKNQNNLSSYLRGTSHKVNKFLGRNTGNILTAHAGTRAKKVKSREDEVLWDGDDSAFGGGFEDDVVKDKTSSGSDTILDKAIKKFKAGKFKDVIKILKKRIKNKKEAFLQTKLFVLAQSYQNIGNYDESIKLFNRIIKMNGAKKDIKNNSIISLSFLYVHTGDINKSTRLLKNFIKKNKGKTYLKGLAIYLVGMNYVTQKNKKEAKKYFKIIRNQYTRGEFKEIHSMSEEQLSKL